ncbi:nucleotide-binding protein [Pseudomonas sp. SIMBA_065]
MTRKTTVAVPVSPKLVLSRAEIERCIARLGDRIAELGAFDISTVHKGVTPELKSLELAVNDTLIRCFGEDTSAYQRFQGAAGLSWSPSFYVTGGPAPDYVGGIGRKVQSAIAMLHQARRSLEEDLSDLEHAAALAVEPPKVAVPSRKVFVVHGHDEAALQGLARFLEKLGLEAVILREQPDQGRTIIEKFEEFSDGVGFAVVLLTPDDVGGVATSDVNKARARQNVIFELGYFSGQLGRGRVCLLRKGEVEIPSDLYGVIYTDMDAAEGWHTKLVKELKAAKLEFDANKLWE